MSSIHLLIPDVALRDAVAEQLKLAKLGAVKEGGDAAQALETDETAALIIDEAALDKKTVKALGAAAGKKCVLLLGTAKDEIGDGMVTESFPKPVRLGHLLARLYFHLEVAPRLRSTPLVFGPFRLEPQNRQLIASSTGAVIRLTEKETALLEYLAQSKTPVAREELLAAIWGYDARIDTHTLETHIYQLRRKLDFDGKSAGLLVNEQGAYRLDGAGAAS